MTVPVPNRFGDRWVRFSAMHGMIPDLTDTPPRPTGWGRRRFSRRPARTLEHFNDHIFII
ncbi:hypothetical protein [Pararobbsia silviterrae]|uniref:hypothetical protein n=1 Tax=Pararobbsia silviterrae TaxID=1792498 RepID=UPI0013144591|nr:hypothetical protein [Pararobbsia silviterrae]